MDAVKLREEMERDLYRFAIEVASLHEPDNPVDAFLDRYAPALVNDARWRALCEMMQGHGDDLAAGYATLDNLADVRIEHAEKTIDAWIARKAREG